MENEGNVENKSIHAVQSVPLFSSAAADSSQRDGSEDRSRKTSKNRRVSFASSKELTQYLEPINPFETLDSISSSKELSSLYRRSCEKHKTSPIQSIVEHLEKLSIDATTTTRTEVLNLRHETLSHESCEALEELFKRVKYKAIDLTSCSLDDVSATAIFDMIEYYEACNELNISENINIKNRGWQSCINMIKRSQALHSLFTRGTSLSDANALSLGNALLSSFIYTLKLEHCGLSGRPILCLSGALQKNKILKELCLANNELNHNDAFHIGNVLKNNYHLQLLDISNNDVQDEGFRHIAEALGYQSVHVNKTTSGDSLLSASKFDFGDLTANLNNINNNRQRFCITPPPKIHVADDGACSNNNNSILQCDNDDKKSDSGSVKSIESDVSSKDASESSSSVAVAMKSTNSAKSEDSAMKDKFKYTTASLSPISHGYDDTTTNHQMFNARSPERSFSSESLCSETSIESNDSKSSIRLIETKFSNRNGTLERQMSNVPPTLESGDKPPTGLQVLIFWNNNLTPKCSPSAADMLESTEQLQIINFGQNPIGNEFLMEIRSSLKTNKSLNSLGLQATQINCDGLKTLGEILQFGGNSTLQRIDLRNNELSVAGLSALSEALKSNKNIIRVDLDDTPKSEMLPMYENSSECQRLMSTIRQQCAHNENPPEPQEAARATSTVQRMKRNALSARKISLTCSSVQVPKILLDPMKKAGSRLRSPSPIPSPIASPLPSPSRSRFLVSRVSESSSGVSSKLTSSTSPSPSSSSGSPTFFPSKSRFRVVSVSEAPQKFQVSSVTPVEPTFNKLLNSESKTEQSKEIDIPIKTSNSAPLKFTPQTTFSNISNSSLLSSQSCEQLLDYEVKTFIDMDSCSSFSSSIDSIDHQTDLSSTESFDFVDKTPIIVEPLKVLEPVESGEVQEHEQDDDKKDIFSNENTLVSTSSSSSSNEGLTLTTNSPTSELSPKQEAQKRVRKTSWIQTAIGVSGKNENYPATLDKLLNLFHHPTSIFTKTSPESTLASSPSSTTGKPKTSQSKDEKLSGMGQKENSISGFFNSLVSMTHKKDDKLTSCESTTILQNISPENTFGKTSSNSQMILESLPKSIKQEVKENISPENTISCENFPGVEKQRTAAMVSPKVFFMVGDEGSFDLPDQQEEVSTTTTAEDSSLDDDDMIQGRSSLGDITRDSMSLLKAKSVSDEVQKSMALSSDPTDVNQK